MKELFIIDVHALLYRSYYALEKQNLRSKTGFPTGAIYGFIQYLNNIFDKYKPEYIVAVMDKGGSQLRSSLYPEYKTNRPPTPDDLKKQVAVIMEVLLYYGINLYYKDGVEADDIIATIARKIGERNLVTIFTKDKDLMQLINRNIKILAPNTTVGGFDIIDSKEVLLKFGVLPEDLGTYLALVGDSSDNIPGVKGIGPKRALRLIKDNPDLIYTLPNFALSKALVNLYDFPELIINMDLFKYNGKNKSEYLTLLKRYDFNQFIWRENATPY